MDRFPAETIVYPGHGGKTSLGEELKTNPYLQGVRAARGSAA